MPKLLGYASVLMALFVLVFLVRVAPGVEGDQGRQGSAANRIVARSVTIVDEKKRVRAILGLNDEDDLNGGVRLRFFDASGHEGVTLVQDDEAGARLYMCNSKGRLYLQIVGVESGDDNGGFVRVGGTWEGSARTAVMRPGMLTFEKDGKETYSLRPPEKGK